MADKTPLTKSIPGETLEAMRERFVQTIMKDAEIMSEQRDQANRDMRFINVPGAMYEGTFGEELNENRAKPELDLISRQKNRFVGQQIQNRVAVEFKPDDDLTSDDDANLITGMYRSDFDQNSGLEATIAAIDEMATCGYGLIRLKAIFENNNDESLEQRIAWEPVPNAYNSGIWDAASLRMDKRDAMHFTMLKLFTEDSFELHYPDKDPVSAYVPENRMEQNFPLGGQAKIWIANFYEIRRMKEFQHRYFNKTTGELEFYMDDDHKKVESVLTADTNLRKVGKKKIINQSVWHSIFSGSEFLQEPTRIAGEFIPYIPFFGFWGYVDGEERYHGLVRKLVDWQLSFNAVIGKIEEDIFSGGPPTPIFGPGQLDGPGIRDQWANRNNLSTLECDSIEGENGEQIYGPAGGYTPAVQIDPGAGLLLEFIPAQIREQTGSATQENIDRNESGKARLARFKREDENTLILSQRIAQAVEWSGTVYLSMANEIYNSPRTVRVLSEDGTEGRKRLFRFAVDEETGEAGETNRLSGKKFRAKSAVSIPYESQVDQAMDDIQKQIEVLAQVPGNEARIKMLSNEMILLSRGLGMDATKKQVRREMLAEGLIEPETEEDEAFMAQLQQQQQQEDPNQALVQAAAQQQEAEARNLDAGAAQKIEDAQLKAAQKLKVLAEIPRDDFTAQSNAENTRIKTLSDIRNQVFQNVSKLPLGG